MTGSRPSSFSTPRHIMTSLSPVFTIAGPSALPGNADPRASRVSVSCLNPAHVLLRLPEAVAERRCPDRVVVLTAPPHHPECFGIQVLADRGCRQAPHAIDLDLGR